MLPFKSKLLLFPYWLTLKLRHFLYDKNIKKSTVFDIPIICVGNITVGGTGKTPHTEMIVRLLKEGRRVAVLSRGYKRKTKGFRIVKTSDDFENVGDEPLQIKQKFPDTLVAVCASRREGIEKLLVEGEERGYYKPDVVILDDAFQHRKIKPTHSVVLMNYARPIFNDNLLPIGNLRDLPEQIKRADSVIISKSPIFGEHDGVIFDDDALAEIAKEEPIWRKNLNLTENQNLYFSIITYGSPLPVFPEEADQRYVYSQSAVCFTGIANDKEFREYVSGSHKIMDYIKFADHKDFTQSDIARIVAMDKKNPTSVIFTTEKDSKRLINNKFLPRETRKRLFYLPIEVKIIPQSKENDFFAQLGHLTF